MAPAPLLTDVIQVNESLRPAVLPWNQKVQIKEALGGKHVQDALADEVRRVIKAAGTTAVLVTHDPVEAQRIADRTVRMSELSSLAQ